MTCYILFNVILIKIEGKNWSKNENVLYLQSRI